MKTIPVSEQRKSQIEQQEALDREEKEIRSMLDQRYDDALTGKARLMDPADVRKELNARHAAFRQPY